MSDLAPAAPLSSGAMKKKKNLKGKGSGSARRADPVPASVPPPPVVEPSPPQQATVEPQPPSSPPLEPPPIQVCSLAIPSPPTPTTMTRSGSPRPPLFKDARRDLFRQLHVEVMNGGKFADVELPLYTRRSRDGGPYATRVLGVNRRMLVAASSEFETQIFANGLEIQTDGYASDSDLELDEDEDEDDDSGSSADEDDIPSSVASIPDSDTSEEQLRTPPATRRDVASLDYDVLSDDSDEKILETRYVLPGTQLPTSSLLDFISDPDLRVGIGESQKKRLHDGAFRTWQAMVLYLYDFDDHIVFKPLRSSNSAVNRPFLSPQVEESAGSWPCSPKSMYRLAHKLKLDELKECAKDSIRSHLTANNIVDELFSDFTWRYPDILRMETEVFYEYSSSFIVDDAMGHIFARIAAGELPHSSVILKSLFGKLVQNNGPPRPQFSGGPAGPTWSQPIAGWGGTR